MRNSLCVFMEHAYADTSFGRVPIMLSPVTAELNKELNSSLT